MFRCCLPLLILVASLLHLQAQTDPVEVTDVDFNNNVGQYNWSNIAIKLRANDNPDPKALDPKYLDNIGVRLTVGYEIDKKKKIFLFMQSEVTIATMETLQDKLFAFWIPEDIIDRNNLPKEPDYWVIELTVDGKEVPMREKNTSRTVNNATMLSTFMSNASGQLSQTEGILVPYYLSPYGPIDRSPPAFIRKEPK